MSEKVIECASERLWNTFT